MKLRAHVSDPRVGTSAPPPIPVITYGGELESTCGLLQVDASGTVLLVTKTPKLRNADNSFQSVFGDVFNFQVAPVPVMARV